MTAWGRNAIKNMAQTKKAATAQTYDVVMQAQRAAMQAQQGGDRSTSKTLPAFLAIPPREPHVVEIQVLEALVESHRDDEHRNRHITAFIQRLRKAGRSSMKDEVSFFSVDC